MPAYRTFRPPHMLSRELKEFLRTEAGSDFASLMGAFPAEWRALVMGGLLRDLLFERAFKMSTQPADMDLVIVGAKSVEEVKSKLGKVSHSANAFGGIKCQLRSKGMVFDLWRIEDHTNMATASKPHTIEQLLRHNLLDIDAILWEPGTECLHDCGCLRAIEARRIGLMGPEGISRRFLSAQIAHVLVIAYKTQFSLAEEVRAFVAEASAQCQPADVERTLERKLPRDAANIEVLWHHLLSGGAQPCPAPTRATL